MKKVFLAFGILILSACGYNGSYRYSCQDPENWEKKECSPPLCNVDGNCTETLLGFNPNETTTTQETVAP